MKTVIQRVSWAQVSVEGELVSRIGPGVLALVGVERGDGPNDARVTARKIAGLRIFPGDKPMDRSLLDIEGEVLVISQFTLAGNLRKGRRPSFNGAEDPALADPLYRAVAAELEQQGLGVQLGRFGADMKVELLNDGPVTLLLHTDAGAII